MHIEETELLYADDSCVAELPFWQMLNDETELLHADEYTHKVRINLRRAAYMADAD